MDALKQNFPLRSEEEMESICAALWKTPPELYALYERKTTGRGHSIQRTRYQGKPIENTPLSNKNRHYVTLLHWNIL